MAGYISASLRRYFVITRRLHHLPDNLETKKVLLCEPQFVLLRKKGHISLLDHFPYPSSLLFLTGVSCFLDFILPASCFSPVFFLSPVFLENQSKATIISCFSSSSAQIYLNSYSLAWNSALLACLNNTRV